MSFAAEGSWIAAALALIALVIQEVRRRQQHENLQRQHQAEGELTTATIAGLRGELSARDEKISTMMATLKESSEAVSILNATNDRLTNDLDKQAVVLALKNEELTASAAQIAVVTRQEGSLSGDARRWFSGVDSEHQHLLSLKEEAKLFAVKIHLATGHLEHLNVTECADLARDFVHLLATGGTSMLRILSSMSMSIKLDTLGRKSDHIIVLLNTVQIGRLNGIFLGAGEQYRHDTIDQARIMPLRQELLELECEILAELRGRLATAPDVQTFQIKWGQMKRSSREAFYNSHFLDAVGKIRLAIEAFLIDLILAQDTDVREHFFAYTVAQQAKELGKITKSWLRSCW
jgi:hypothetical protein